MKLPGLIYDSPHRFTARQRMSLGIVPPAIGLCFRGILATSRIDVRNEEVFENTLARHGHAIILFWHEFSGLGIYYFRNRNYHTTTSMSYDGELAARLIQHFGSEAVRGSSSRGGSEALRELEKAIRLIPCVGITPDGPRGPRRVAKPGAAILAARTQVPIQPVAFTVNPAWQLRSWDKMPIPKPGARITIQYADPILPPPDDSPEAVETARAEMENKLNAVHAVLDAEAGGVISSS